MKKGKKTELQKVKENLWELCRQLTFLVYGNVCYTCDATNLVGRNLQCGHFITSSTCSTELRYSLENLRPQCFSCNINKSGNWVEFEKRLKADGVSVAKLKKRNNVTKGRQYLSSWYDYKITEYTRVLQELTT